MAKKLTVKRFKTWSPDHQDSVLKGFISTDKFNSGNRKQQRRWLATAHERYQSAKQARNDPATVLNPLTPLQVDKQVNAAADYKYGPVTTEIRSGIADSAARETALPSYFNEYRQALAQANAEIQANYQAAQGAANTQAQQGQTQSQTQNAALTAAETADAAKRGATVNPELARVAQQAADSRRSSSDANTALMSTTGSNRFAAMANQRTNSYLGQMEATGAERKRADKFRGDLRSALSEKGDFATTTRGDIIARERDNSLDLQALQFNQELTGLKFNEDTRQAKVQEKQNQQKINLDKQSQRETKRKNADALAMSTAEFKAKYGLGPKKAGEMNAAQWDAYLKRTKRGPYDGDEKDSKPPAESTQSRNARSSIANVQSIVDVYKTRGSDRQRAAELYRQRHPGGSQLVLSAALDLAYDGHVSSNNMQMLKGAGVRVPKSWRLG